METFPQVANNHVLRDNFARSAKGLVDASGFDGIDSKCCYPRPLMARQDGDRMATDSMLRSCMGVPIR